MNRGSVIKAAILGGILAGLAASIPYVDFLNKCCCLLAVGGGLFSAWVLRSDSGGVASTARCALSGFVAGAISGLVSVPLRAVIGRLAFGTAELEARIAEAREAMEGSGWPMDPQALDIALDVQRAMEGLDFNAWLAVGALLVAAFSAFFGLLGGLLGGAVFQPRGSRASHAHAADTATAAGVGVAPPAPTPEGGDPVPHSEGDEAGASPGAPGGRHRPREGEIPPEHLPRLPDDEDPDPTGG